VVIRIRNFVLSSHVSLADVPTSTHTFSDFNTVLTHHIYLHSALYTYRPFATTAASQLKIGDFSGETFKGFEVLYFSVGATATQLLSSGRFCKQRYDAIPVKSASANVSFYTNNSKMPNFELWHSCRQ